MLADVDTAAAPGLFKGAVTGVQGFANYVNAHGGIAGRKLVVDFIDTKLSADLAQQGLIQACQNDFAIVDTSALFLNNLTPLVTCKDKAGNATGLPDFPDAATDFAHQCSPVSYTYAGDELHCDTKSQHPQTYTVNTGAEQWFATSMGISKGSWMSGNDIKGTLDATYPIVAAEQNSAHPMHGENFLVSGLAPQSTYTPYVERLQSSGTGYVEDLAANGSMVLVRKEAALQGNTSVKAWTCTTICYGKSFIQAGGSAVNGTYVTLPYIPIEEANLTSEVNTMVQTVGANNVDGFVILSWIQSLLFQDSVEATVHQFGQNGLTRANLLTAVKGIHSFNAGGMIGNVDVGNRQVYPCFMLTQIKNGQFVQVYPTQKGALDCNAANLTTTTYNNES